MKVFNFSGLIKYHTQPPVVENTEIGAALVTELGKEFDIASLSSQEGSVLTSLPVYRPSQTMVVASLGPVMEVKDRDDEAEKMDSGGEEQNEGAKVVSWSFTVNLSTIYLWCLFPSGNTHLRDEQTFSVSNLLCSDTPSLHDEFSFQLHIFPSYILSVFSSTFCFSVVHIWGKLPILHLSMCLNPPSCQWLNLNGKCLSWIDFSPQ